MIPIEGGSYRLKKSYTAGISRSFTVRSPKALTARRNCEGLISQLLGKGDSNYPDLVATACDRGYKFVMYRAVIPASQEMSDLSKASAKT